MTEKCSLSDKSCIPCKGGVPPLDGADCRELLKQLDGEWQLHNDHHIEREFKFKNFRQALDFTNKVGDIAEEQGHHPDIELGWGRVKLTIFTHKINGLTESDFILAAKADSAL